ncbi:MMPL family transporter [Paenibacillus methanolicus]|uniref:RND superfamily putative drug exporter n=1 Tax=Paenibacillus methanolicus TaxID=582686 RepID=A0A5S5BYT9_9BACL|nr:MMPL family transporter [Paenibacillus methanolicus]TYP71240.1 RND superfamily putative drug exporter [Paenibacillus methanolicus]
MRTILKLRWVMIVLWIALAAGLMATAPNMADLVREKGQVDVPDGYSSSNAGQLIEAMEEQGGESSGASTVLVFHNDQGLSEADNAEIKATIERLKQEKAQYGIGGVTSHVDTPELAEQMVAKDGKTVLALLNVQLDGRTPVEAADAIHDAVKDVKVEHYYTGNWLISEDVVQSSQEGLKKTELITAVFIIAILFLVFRSVVAPFIPLLTVGFSYLVSQSVVAFLVKYADFPLSNFTQIFMVAVLFGIGTDYCILLISRYKEELAHTNDRTEAIVTTYRTAGRTVIFSGLAVLVGFASIGFSTFVLYRSAVAVAVGVAVMLIALVTIVPFFMAVLGNAIFWPSKAAAGHKPSRLWGSVGRFSLKRPLWAIAILAVLTIPFLIAYQGSTSFNSLDEIGEKYDSVKGFNIIADSFGPGDSLPSTVVVKTDKPLDNSEGLAAIEQLSRELAKVDGVKTVRSATRPTGEALEDMQVTDQVTQLEDGIGKSEEGIGQITDGLAEASSSLAANAPKLNEAVDGVGDLIAGTNALKQGVEQLGGGLKQLQQGLASGAAGAAELKAGLAQAKSSADQLTKASEQLLGNYKKMAGGLGQVSNAYGTLTKQQASIAAGLDGLGQSLSGLASKYPDLAADPEFQRAQGSVSALADGAKQLSGGMSQLNGQLATIVGGLNQANAGFSQAYAGQSQLTQGLGKLAAGIGQLQAGVAKAADGQGQIVAKLPALTGGFDRLAAGQKELQDGFAQISGQLGQLTDGLNQSVDGLSQVSDGLGSAGDYLTGLASAPDKQLAGWYIPQEAIDGEEFQAALDVYLSEDRQTVKFDVVFGGNPYEIETLEKVSDLDAAITRALKGTAFADAEYAVGGVSSINNDLRNISAEDYSRTVVLMLIGIGIILIVLFRSIVMPIYLILSLLITFYTSMAIAEVIFVRIMGLSGISWAVPFFGFVMLMALGIDYSIFLMDRFKEYRHLSPKEAILRSMENMGTVIMSAALILGGTFAAMLPSGVMSLLQIATIVLCGLFMYALVMLPLFIPVMVRVFGEANWWPFMNRKDDEDDYVGQPTVAISGKSDSHHG